MKNFILLITVLISGLILRGAKASESDIERFNAWVGLSENNHKLSGVDQSNRPCEVMIGPDGIFGVGVAIYPINSIGNPDLNHSTFAYVYEKNNYEQKIKSTTNEIRIHLRIPGGIDRDNILGIPVPYGPKASEIVITKNDLSLISSVSLKSQDAVHFCGHLDQQSKK